MTFKKRFEQSKIVKYIIKIANTSWGAKTIAAIVVWGIALIPFYIYLLARWITNPEGFWQQLAVIVICGMTIGWLQIIALFFAVIITLKLILEDL